MFEQFKRDPVKFLVVTVILFVIGQIVESLAGKPIQDFFQQYWANEIFLRSVLPILIGIVMPTLAVVALIYGIYRFVPDQVSPAPKQTPEGVIAERPMTADESALLTVLSDVGVVAATTRLSSTKFEPVECMRQAKKHLLFMGILGSKWVNTHADEFAEFLQRIDAQNGEAKFLLINPEGKAYAKLYELRGGKIKLDSLQRLYEYTQKYNCLRVKLYDDLPSFRLILIDELTLGLSRYKLDQKGHFESKYGWEAPHVVISSSANWSLFWAFEQHYFNVWNRSTDLEDYIAQMDEASIETPLHLKLKKNEAVRVLEEKRK